MTHPSHPAPRAVRCPPRWLLAGGAVVLAAVAVAAALSLWPRGCGPRADDPQNYLLHICEYIKANKIDVSPGDPARYNILSVTEGAENGRAVVRVQLDCCYLGDRAVIDKATGEVLDFALGAK